jgi:hypothetical protein
MEGRGRLSIGTQVGQCRVQQKSCTVGLSARGLRAACSASLEKRELVRPKVMSREAAEVRETKLAKAKRGQPREGRRVLVSQAPRAGRRLLEVVLPGHAKVVKALMRVLDGREQDTLRKLCEKLREEDIVKYIQEMTYED